MKRIILFAPIGGITGSLLGSIVMAVRALTSDLSEKKAVIGAIQAGLGYPIFTVILTIPACLVIGSPVIFCLKGQLVRNPLPWSILVAGMGVCLGYLCLGWAFRSATNSEPLELLLLFSGTSAFSYAFLYGWRTQRRLHRKYA